MRLVRLATEIDFDGWRNAARSLVADAVRPEEIDWVVGDEATLLGSDPVVSGSDPGFKIPRSYLALARRAILHSDPLRFAVLYRLLWRLRAEPKLMDVASDADVARARAMEDAVSREIHKTHAFVRFREVSTDDGPVYIAWFEPVHHTLEAAAPFFVRRFAAMRFSILTPRVSAHWDGDALRFGPGAARADAPDGDALESLWRTYYASIFNPARLKTDTMRAHMPARYWRNLPEAALITSLAASAPRATQHMIEEPASTPRLRAPAHAADVAEHDLDSLPAIARAAKRCTACALCTKATQTVFGEGPEDASVMFVGEQPGDQEDLVGRPFVGPAGQLFDRGLAQAGIERAAVYVTNAVKHFKFEPRGRRRIHKTPAQQEIEACRPWLEREIALVQPRLIVAMGATAAHAVLGRPTAVQKNRGRLMRVSDDTQVLVTVHPSYLLRVPEERQAEEYARFVEDLQKVSLRGTK
jgi:DNA polymerase